MLDIRHQEARTRAGDLCSLADLMYRTYTDHHCVSVGAKVQIMRIKKMYLHHFKYAVMNWYYGNCLEYFSLHFAILYRWKDNQFIKKTMVERSVM